MSWLNSARNAGYSGTRDSAVAEVEEEVALSGAPGAGGDKIAGRSKAFSEAIRDRVSM